MYHNSTKAQMRFAIQSNVWNFKNAIDFAYPQGSAHQVNEVVSDVVRKVGADATMFFDSIEPLADILESAGMTETEAWKRVAL